MDMMLMLRLTMSVHKIGEKANATKKKQTKKMGKMNKYYNIFIEFESMQHHMQPKQNILVKAIKLSF